MQNKTTLFTVLFSTALLGFTVASPAQAATPEQSVDERIEALEQGLRQAREELKEAEKTREKIRQLEQLLAETQKKVGDASSEAYAEENATQKFHLAGYAFAGLETDRGEEDDSSFTAGSFNPIFHYQYKNWLFWESELEFETAENGETEVALEYSAANILINDYMTLRAGKWLSPIGQFRERLHPAWINKLPNAPAGFGHDGAQPLSDVGIQLRGGAPLGDAVFTYSLAVGNGPRIGTHGLELEGFGSDDNDDKSIGGRIAFLPIPSVELGASYLSASVNGEGSNASQGDYELWGADFAITPGTWEFRGEYLRSELDSLVTEHDGAATLLPDTEWEAWYLQSSYQLRGLTSQPVLARMEPVIRYSNFDVDGFDEFAEGAEKRISVGINYLFAPSVIAKVAFESSDFDAPERDDNERVTMQVAFGF